MLTLAVEDTGIVAITASDRLTEADYERFVPEFERIAAAHGPVHLLIELRDFHGWDAAGLWQELRFDMSHQHDMDRVAIIGDKAWQDWGTRLSKPFFKAEVRYFDPGQETEARIWLAAP